MKYTLVGNTILETTATTTTAAINELNTAVSLLGDSAGGNVGALFTQLGNLSSLATTADSNIVAAINELDRRMPDIYNSSGTLLNT